MNEHDDRITDLNFAPDWARKPAGLKVFTSKSRHTTEQTHKKSMRDSAKNETFRGKKQYSNRSSRPYLDKQASLNQYAQKAVPAITISFIPERRGLKPIARWLALQKKAYSLSDVASMFLKKPEFFAIKLKVEAERGKSDNAQLYQCMECKAVFFFKDQAIAHVLDKHFSLFYRKEEVHVDLPKGSFSSVARCELNGKLLGPPNYHGYNDNVADLYDMHFAHLSPSEYQSHIVNSTDKTLIEQWRHEATIETRYFTLNSDKPLEFRKQTEVKKHFLKNYADNVVRTGSSFIIPGPASRTLADNDLRQRIQDSWEKEKTFSLKMAIAIYPAFRHLGLYIFKTQAKRPFVSAIHPKTINPSKTTPLIQSILKYLEEYPMSSRHKIIESVAPNLPPDSPKIAEIISQLHWLIEKGHIVEFFDGTLSIPNCYYHKPKDT